MKTTFKTPVAITTALVASLLALGAFTHTSASHAQANATAVQEITVVGKRMSAQEKLAFDLGDGEIQTVIISAKHLSKEQKLADLHQELNASHQVAAN
jgi:hypothetical protein